MSKHRLADAAMVEQADTDEAVALSFSWALYRIRKVPG